MSINSGGTLAYVSDYTLGYVFAIDTALDTVVASINVGGTPYGIAAT